MLEGKKSDKALSLRIHKRTAFLGKSGGKRDPDINLEYPVSVRGINQGCIYIALDLFGTQ